MSRVSYQKGPTRHAYAWQIGPFSQDILDLIIDVRQGCFTGTGTYYDISKSQWSNLEGYR